MQFRQQPQSAQWKIAFLIIALVDNVSCIRNANGNDEPQHISAKLKNFFPSEALGAINPIDPEQTSARVTNGGFRPSQMLEFTPSDVMHSGLKRYPPSYVEPNYKHQLPSSLGFNRPQQSAMDKQFSFPDDSGQPQSEYHTSFHPFASTQVPTTPVVSYLDPFTQQNYRYTPTPTPTPPTYIQYQREEPEREHGDQVYTVQSTLLVGNNHPAQPPARPGTVDDVYLKRPGYVFDESPAPAYRRPATTTISSPAASANKISYDSHDYPPPSYASQQTSNFVAQPQRVPRPTAPATAATNNKQTTSAHRPPYNNRQDVNDNRPLAASSIHEAAYASQPQYSTSSNYANNFGNYLQRPPAYPGHPQQQQQQVHPPTHYQYEPLLRPSSQQQQQRPGHNYYEYQIGEIPPRPQQQQQQQQFNYRPGSVPGYRPPYQQQPEADSGTGGGGGGVGLATLASLFSSTQQYAPQFTNLLLGGAGAGSPSSSSPLGSLLGAFTGTQTGGQQPYTRPPNTQLIRALENIARNDDLQCVPKVLCQMIAGQTLRGQLPGFITSPAITNFLAGFPVASPALIYGRAALLGISGGERSCLQTYHSCPKNEMEIIHYLNNHRGGFFKFFSEPEDQPAVVQQSEAGGGSLFSILSALTGGVGGGGGGGQHQQIQSQITRTTPRPLPRPTQKPSGDIANGIGSFFTRVLSEYLNGVEYQRRRRRRSLLPTEIKRNIQTDNGHLMPVDFHDEEDDLDTQTIVKFQDDAEAEDAKAHTELIGVLQFPDDEGEGRILHFKGIESDEHHHDVRFPDATAEAKHESERKIINDFNRSAAQRKLRFPQDENEDEGKREAKQLELAASWASVLPNGLGADDYGVDKRRGKRIVFKDTNEQLEDIDERIREEQAREEEERFKEEQQLREGRAEPPVREGRAEQPVREGKTEQHTPPNAVYENAAPPQRGARVIFPDHYERHIRKGKILTRPTYAPSYEYSAQGTSDEKEQRLVVSDEHRPPTYYRLETTPMQSHMHSFMNYGEYMPGSTVRFEDLEDFQQRPAYVHYNYPNTNYIGDDRYSSSYGTTRRPKHEDDKNIYVTNAQGITEYYLRPDGHKVYLNNG